MRTTPRVRKTGTNCAAWSASWAVAALLLAFTTPLFATTLVVRLENGRILLGADTRQQRFNPIQQTMRQSLGDDARCKMRAFGTMGFAITGIVEYSGYGATATLPDWNAYDDADAAWKTAGANLHDVAAAWAKRSAEHFTRLYELDPASVKQLAGANPDRLLQIAFFAGWDKAAPVFLVEILSYEPGSSPVIQVKALDRPINDAPFSTNAITQELIDGTTDRAQQAAAEWDELSENIPGNELAWKHLAFYIQKTAPYDPSVSPVVDVLSIPANKPPEWLQRGACF